MTPSAQTEWEEIFKLLVVKECREMDTVREAYREPINNIIKFMRTRLLSVESMKMVEKVPIEPKETFTQRCAEVKYQNELRQSILSEMEKGE